MMDEVYAVDSLHPVVVTGVRFEYFNYVGNISVQGPVPVHQPHQMGGR